MTTRSTIRNFVIIAHIDHGKSTLADRFIELTHTIEGRVMKEQFLDQLESERERGITIKMAPIRMLYEHKGQAYELNLIDTPGHSDFGYEVSRALMAVEGAILLVDGTQGIQAQTLANFENAHRAGLKIIGAINKVDMNPPQLEEMVRDVAELIGCAPEDVLRVSARTGLGVEALLGKVIDEVPPPESFPDAVTNGARALIFDSFYDDHKGIIAIVRVTDGSFTQGDEVIFMATDTKAKVKEVGSLSPRPKLGTVLSEGEIGYISTGIKDPDRLKIGDTLMKGTGKSLPGYKEPQPVVFVSFYPEDPNEHDALKSALGKLRLTDAALSFEAETSEVLGRGFKGGFLGNLHFEIAAERLLKEFGIETVHSFPSVAYRVKTKGEWRIIHNPKDFPAEYEATEEPMAHIEILTPPAYIGSVLALRDVFRFGEFGTKTIGTRIMLDADLPLADLMSDLDDRLKSLSEGYASLSYTLTGYAKGDLEKIEILVAGHVVPGLTRILPKNKLEREGRLMVERLKDLLPRQQFSQAIQAAARGRVIARETVPAMKKALGDFGKNGGDRTRKMKLWAKQARGKERLQERGEKTEVRIPASIFKELMKK